MATANYKPLTFKYPAVEGKTRDYTLLPASGAAKYSGWFPRGRVHLIAGASGSGKTTLIVDALMKASRGEMVLGHKGTGLRPLILFADRGRLSNLETLDRMGLSEDETPIEHLSIVLDGAAVEAILTLIEATPRMPQVVFVEGGDFLVGDPNKSQIVAPFIDACRKIAEHYHIALILSVGSSKSKPQDAYKLKRDHVTGTQAWSRTSDDILILAQPGDGTESDRDLDFMHRNAPAEKFSLIFKNGLLTVKQDIPETITAPPVKLDPVTKTLNQMIAVIKELPAGSRLTPDQFAWMAEKTVYRHFKTLAEPEYGWAGKQNGKWVTKMRIEARENSHDNLSHERVVSETHVSTM